MKVLVIGGGGREHAMAWKLSQSPKVTKVYVAPGNGGTALNPKLENVAISDVRELRTWAQAEKIALTVVGPEAPLAAGVVDEFRAHGLRIFGPTKAAAQLESSKAFSKHGGNMGTEGSVVFQFKHCGQLFFAPGTSEDKVMEVALEAGAEDVVTDEDGAVEVLTAPADFETVKNALEAAGLTAEVAGVTMRPENTIELTGEDAAKMQKLLDVLEDLDDTQEVYHNAAL